MVGAAEEEAGYIVTAGVPKEIKGASHHMKLGGAMRNFMPRKLNTWTKLTFKNPYVRRAHRQTQKKKNQNRSDFEFITKTILSKENLRSNRSVDEF